MRIETGRYTAPKTPRNERTCRDCNCVEDEHHAIFVCPLYANIRAKYRDFLLRLSTIKELLNPYNIHDANVLGDMLIQVERIRKTEKL